MNLRSLQLLMVPLFASGISASPGILSAPDVLNIDLMALAQRNPLLRFQDGLRLATGTATDLERALLYLNFDEPAAPLLQDRRGLYRVIEADYTPSPEAHSGTNSAFFRFRRQTVRLRTTEDLWPLQHQESFTISFWVRPGHFFRSSNLFRRIGYASGERRGLEILLEQDRLKLNLEGVLKYGDDVEKQHSIQVPRRLKQGQWYHLAVSVDLRKSRVIVFLDGREEGRFRLDQNGRLPEISFDGPELAPIQIGGDFIGQIDELMILEGALSEESELDTSPFGKLIYNHKSGRGTLPVIRTETPVYQLKSAVEKIQLKATGSADRGSSLRLFYRTSSKPFNAQSRTIPWTRLGDLSAGPTGMSVDAMKDGPGFIQMRIEWQPDPSGNVSPVLKSLAIEQSIIDPPIRPSGVRVIEELSRNGKICIEWRINPEMEVEERGGYRVHVGVRSGEYEAVVDKMFSSQRTGDLVLIRYKNMNEFPLTLEEQRQERLRPERIREWKRSHVRLLLDNDLLSRARFSQKIGRPLPYFEDDHPYYFAVSAYVHNGATSPPSESARSLFHLR